MDLEEEKLIQLYEKERSAGLFDIKVGGIKIYNYLFREVRIAYLNGHGFTYKGQIGSTSKMKKIVYILISFFQIVHTIFFRRVENIIYAFRIERTKGVYMDKFTDPLIDNSNLREGGYVILEHAIDGEHFKPRLHARDVVYMDFFDFIIVIGRHIIKKKLKSQYSLDLDKLWSGIDEVMDGISYDKDYLSILIYRFFIEYRLYAFLFRKIKAKRLIAASKINFRTQIYAAKYCGVKVCELQHGMHWGWVSRYLVPTNTMFSPDYFMMYGGLCPMDKTGVPIANVKNMGFAYLDYLKELNDSREIEEDSVLFLSDSFITSQVFDLVILLADKYKSIKFVIRPHPMEKIEEKLLVLVKKYANIVVQPPKESLLVVLNNFNMVIGGNSVSLYEAASMEKKVGRLCYKGVIPLYINESDKECFWLIDGPGSFDDFLQGSVEDKQIMRFYTKYDRAIFDSFLSE